MMIALIPARAKLVRIGKPTQTTTASPRQPGASARNTSTVATIRAATSAIGTA